MCQVPSAASVPTTVPVPSQEDGSTVWCKDLFTDEKGKWLGLLVQEKHASKFFAEEGQRKTHEVRTRQVKFLKPNDKIALIAVNPRGDKAYRKILGTLKFEGNVAIPRSSFNDFFPKHQVTMDELDKISRGKNLKGEENLGIGDVVGLALHSAGSTSASSSPQSFCLQSLQRDLDLL